MEGRLATLEADIKNVKEDTKEIKDSLKDLVSAFVENGKQSSASQEQIKTLFIRQSEFRGQILDITKRIDDSDKRGWKLAMWVAAVSSSIASGATFGVDKLISIFK